MNKRSGEGIDLPANNKRRKTLPTNESILLQEAYQVPFGMASVDEEWGILENEARTVVLLPSGPKDRFGDVCLPPSSAYNRKIVPVRETLCYTNDGNYVNANSMFCE